MTEAAAMGEAFRARLVPELKVSDLAASLTFWCDRLGFRVLYDRAEDGFAYLDRDGAQIMLDQRGCGAAERRGIWETAPMALPFGRGVNFQIQASDLEAIRSRLERAGVPIYFGPETRWYRVGTKEIGVRQFLVQDPDGYLVRLQEKIGERPAHQPAATS
jgi:catechol 2,3-dioxygenase-like lactoylglutathione lyase family enzyme